MRRGAWRRTSPSCRSYCVGDNKSASLIGRLGSSAFRLFTTRGQCHSRARASLRNRHIGPSIMGFEDEVEQSLGRPCRQTDGSSKQTRELTSSIVPRGTPFHHSVELEFPPAVIWFYVAFMPLRFPWSSGTLCRQPRYGAGSRPTVAPVRQSLFSSRAVWQSASPRP